jgi:hypothetical protein
MNSLSALAAGGVKTLKIVGASEKYRFLPLQIKIGG